MRWYLLCTLLLSILLCISGFFHEINLVVLWIVLAITAFMGTFCLFIKYEAHCFKSFEDVDNGKRELYGGKRVLVVVPHQDDEINLLGGVFEEYLKYGSEIFPVYVITNGSVEAYRFPLHL